MTDRDYGDLILRQVTAQRDDFAKRLQAAGMLEEHYTQAGAVRPPPSFADGADYVEFLCRTQGTGTAIKWAEERISELETQNRGLRRTHDYALRLEELVGEIRSMADTDRAI